VENEDDDIERKAAVALSERSHPSWPILEGRIAIELEVPLHGAMTTERQRRYAKISVLEGE
jgi:hypothetical protein